MASLAAPVEPDALAATVQPATPVVLAEPAASVAMVVSVLVVLMVPAVKAQMAEVPNHMGNAEHSLDKSTVNCLL